MGLLCLFHYPYVSVHHGSGGGRRLDSHRVALPHSGDEHELLKIWVHVGVTYLYAKTKAHMVNIVHGHVKEDSL